MKSFNTIDERELEAAKRVIERRQLSGYVATLAQGGEEVTRLEALWADEFDVEYAVACNSATSGLLAACMVAGVTHGDEVIVSPYTMSATAAAPKILGANITWADIDSGSCTISPVEVSNKITRHTRAIIATNLFGHPARLKELYDLCEKNGIWLIEDNAQAIFSRECGRFTGTVGHMGVFSLNVHKQLQTGEGGVVVTHSAFLDRKLRKAINHGEMRGGHLGLNLRMTELTAALAIEQLKKKDEIIASRRFIWEELSRQCREKRLPIIPPGEREGCFVSPYAWAGLLHTKDYNGRLPFPLKKGYMQPLYRLSAFHKHQVPGIATHCPVTEAVESRIVLFELCSFNPSQDEITELIEELAKVL